MPATIEETLIQTPVPALVPTPAPTLPPDAPTIPLVEDSATRRGLVERVLVSYAAWRIVHATDGFHVANIPDPTDPEYLDPPSGRGLLLMRAFMNDMRNNAAGNQVTMVNLQDAAG